jgi:parvulin-like peptidyl-prolyl isomerase
MRQILPLLAAALAVIAPQAFAGGAETPAPSAPTASALPACPACARDAEPVAIVGGVPITRGEYKEFLLLNIGDGLLETLVNQKLIRAYAETMGVRVTEEDEARWIEQQIEDMQAVPELKDLDKAEVRKRYRPHASMFALIDRLVKARRTSEEGLRREYEVRYGERRRARHILFQVKRKENGTIDQDSLLAAEKRAMDVYEQLKKGGDFGELARRFSEDPGSRNQGGELPEFGRGDMVPEFAEVAFKLEEGAISEPILSNFGWHIVQVTKILPPAKPFDEEVKAELKAEAARRPVDRQEYGRFLDEVRAKANVKILFGEKAGGK